jgi:hypothetical protein
LASGKWTRFGWEGVVLGHPRDWEVTSVDVRGPSRTAALVDEEGAAAAVLRWEKPRRRFSPDRALLAVEKSARRAAGRARARELSFESPVHVPGIRKAMGGREFRTFRWELPGTGRAKTEGGAGLVAFCGECGRASVLQVFDAAAGGGRAAVAARVLTSFRDHAEGDSVIWQAFGLAFESAAGYEYSGHGYDPRGLFRLSLRRSQETLAVFRWALARSQLEAVGGNLERFFRKSFRKDVARNRLGAEHGEFEGHAAVLFRPRGKGPLARVGEAVYKALAFRRRPVLCGLVWHCEEDNAIYAAALLSREEDALARACGAARGLLCGCRASAGT